MQPGQLTQTLKFYSTEHDKNQYGEEAERLEYRFTARANAKQINGNRTEDVEEIIFNYVYEFTVRKHFPV